VAPYNNTEPHVRALISPGLRFIVVARHDRRTWDFQRGGTCFMRRTAILLLGLIGGLTWVHAAHAQDRTYPNRPIRIIQGFSMGGIGDTLSRVVGDKLGERLGQPVIVESRKQRPTAIRCSWVTPPSQSLPAGRKSYPSTR
jgi:hypothetical protein